MPPPVRCRAIAHQAPDSRSGPPSGARWRALPGAGRARPGELPKAVRLETPPIQEVADVLTRAFFEVPLQTYIFPDGQDNVRYSPDLFRTLAIYGQLSGELWTIEGAIEGTTVWLRRPTQPARAEAIILMGNASAALTRAATPYGGLTER